MPDRHIIQLSNAITDYVEERSELRNLLDSSELGRKFFESSQGLCQTLEKIRQTGDLDAMIEAEVILLADQVDAALSHSPLWPEELRSIALADEQMAKGLRCYDQFLKDIEAYKAETALHAERASDKYPHDSFRVFLDAQHARLQNALKMPYTEAEKTALTARDGNVKAMNRLYKALQKERLPEPVREIGALAKYWAEREATMDKIGTERQIGEKKKPAQKK